MIKNKSGFAKSIAIERTDGTRKTFPAKHAPWYMEVKGDLIEICSNAEANSVNTYRTYIPLANIREIETQDE